MMHRLFHCAVPISAVPVAACNFTSLRTLPFGRSQFLSMFCSGIFSQSHGLPCVRVEEAELRVTIESGLCDVREVVWWGLMKSRLHPPAPTVCCASLHLRHSLSRMLSGSPLIPHLVPLLPTTSCHTHALSLIERCFSRSSNRSSSPLLCSWWLLKAALNA